MVDIKTRAMCRRLALKSVSLPLKSVSLPLK
jgi:hypothetical protein